MFKATHRIVALVVILTFVMMGAVQAQGKKVIYSSRQMGPDDIPTLDPAVAEDVPSIQVISQIFPELVRANELTSANEDGMATVSISDDGLVFTFNITPKVPWVRYDAASDSVVVVTDENGNPRYVTAADFAYGMMRSLDPALASYYGGVLSKWVAGAKEYNTAGEGADLEALKAAVGIKVVDDYTLEVTASKPSPIVESIFAMWMTVAQPQWVIEEFGDFWIEAENIVSYGPFAIKSWDRNAGGSLVMVKNPHFPGSNAIPQAKIDEVVFRFLDVEAQFTAYEAGELDVSEVPPSAIARIRSDAELSKQLHVDPGSGTYYYGFNVRIEPFNDPRAVLAFSLAIDREAITTNITGRGEIPAGFFSSPTLVAAPTSETHPDIAVSYNPEEAKALWEAYLADTGKKSSDFALNILHNNSSLHAAIAQAIQQMWKETLGVSVNITAQDFGTYLSTRRDADIFRAGWLYDYPDTNNFLFDVFHSSNDPDTGFNNAEFDALVEQAQVLSDTDARRELYAQAEKLLIRDAAAIAPIYYYVALNMTKPYVERTYSVIGREYYEKWDINR